MVLENAVAMNSPGNQSVNSCYVKQFKGKIIQCMNGVFIQK